MIQIDLRFYRGNYKGGVLNICISQIKALLKKRIKVRLLVDSNDRKKEFKLLFQKSKYIEIKVIKIKISYAIDTLLFSGFIRCDNYKIHYWPWYVKPIINPFSNHEILGLWDITPITYPQSYKKIVALILNIGIRISTRGDLKILSCSKFDCLEIIRVLKPKSEPIYYPLTLDNTESYDIIFKSRKIKEFNLIKNKKLITFLSYGNIYDRREIPFLLKAIENLNNTSSLEFRLILIGEDATSASNIDELCKKYNYSIVRSNYLNKDELDNYITQADYGVCLSTQDGTSYILLEYALSGVPIITTELMSKEINNDGIIISKNLKQNEFKQLILNDLKEKKESKFKQLNSARKFVKSNFPNNENINISCLINYK